jgi:hypothetical protein
VAASGNLAFAAGVTTATVQVQVKGDRTLERRFERFFLSLINPSTGAVVEQGQAIGRIKNDDSATRFVVKKVSGHVRVHGSVSPPHPNKLVVVTLTRGSTARGCGWESGVRTSSAGLT